jgi:hypothetical protein
MNNVTTVGIDLAKNVFYVHGVDASGHEVLRRTVPRDQLMALVVQLPTVTRHSKGLKWSGARSAVLGERIDQVLSVVWSVSVRTLVGVSTAALGYDLSGQSISARLC